MRHSSTIAFYTLGCKLNFSETSGIARLFEENGYARVDFKEGADVVVINTCSVTENADKKCRQIVKQARNLSMNSFIAVIGCYAQLKPEEIASIEGVNIVLGAEEKFNLLQHVEEWQEHEFSNKIVRSEIKYVKEFVPSFSVFPNPTQAETPLSISMELSQTASALILISDAQGKTISQQFHTFERGFSIYEFLMGNRPSGLYTIGVYGTEMGPKHKKIHLLR